MTELKPIPLTETQMAELFRLRQRVQELTAERDSAIKLQDEANALLIEQARTNESLKLERSDLMQSIHDQADRYDELSQELELSDALQRDKVAKLTAERDKATQYWQIAEGRCDALMKQRDELIDLVKYFINEVPMTSSQYELCRQALASVKEKA